MGWVKALKGPNQILMIQQVNVIRNWQKFGFSVKVSYRRGHVAPYCNMQSLILNSLEVLDRSCTSIWCSNLTIELHQWSTNGLVCPNKHFLALT
jgi:hypothetical protein